MKKDHIDFQDNSVPLAFFITFRCYGSWLHGDRRGAVDRRFHNRFGTPRMSESVGLNEAETRLTNGKGFLLDKRSIDIVFAAIENFCMAKDYQLFALNVLSNHVHLVMGCHGKVERLMNAVKSCATKSLREAGSIGEKFRPWARHGSTRYLWRDSHVEAAIDYVLYAQGNESDFDRSLT